MDLPHVRSVLERAGVDFARGLTPRELQAAEEHFHFTFPPDLRSFLSYAMPVGGRFPPWRDLDNAELARQFNWPIQGICFDIEQNEFWPPEWGIRPSVLEDAFAIARARVAAAPKLIPISGHRYMPDRPHASGNPVFSVYQTDIIYYGGDLENYLCNEYHYYFGTPQYALSSQIRPIEFWSWLVELNT